MKKREFATLVKNLKEDVVHNIEARRKELNEKVWNLRKAYEEEVRKALLEKIKSGELLKEINIKAVHVITARLRTDEGTTVVPTEFWLGYFKMPDDIPPMSKAMSKELTKARKEYYTLTELRFKAKRLIDAWKLRGIEHKTYNKEPFPEELCPYVSEEFRELINCGGEKE